MHSRLRYVAVFVELRTVVFGKTYHPLGREENKSNLTKSEDTQQSCVLHELIGIKEKNENKRLITVRRLTVGKIKGSILLSRSTTRTKSCDMGMRNRRSRVAVIQSSRRNRGGGCGDRRIRRILTCWTLSRQVASSLITKLKLSVTVRR